MRELQKNYAVSDQFVKIIPESSRLGFLEMFLRNNFALSDSEDNTSMSLNRGVTADLLLLRPLFGICKKYLEPSFWEVMKSFVLLAYASLAASKALLQWLLACFNVTLDSEDLFCWCCWKQKSYFYELWQQHKELENTETNETWPDIFDDRYIHWFQPERTYKIH